MYNDVTVVKSAVLVVNILFNNNVACDVTLVVEPVTALYVFHLFWIYINEVYKEPQS